MIKEVIVKIRIPKIDAIIIATTRVIFLKVSGIGACGVSIRYAKTMIAQP